LRKIRNLPVALEILKLIENNSFLILLRTIHVATEIHIPKRLIHAFTVSLAKMDVITDKRHVDKLSREKRVHGRNSIVQMCFQSREVHIRPTQTITNKL
jgi:hypothetical protein